MSFLSDKGEKSFFIGDWNLPALHKHYIRKRLGWKLMVLTVPYEYWTENWQKLPFLAFKEFIRQYLKIPTGLNLGKIWPFEIFEKISDNFFQFLFKISSFALSAFGLKSSASQIMCRSDFFSFQRIYQTLISGPQEPFPIFFCGK